MGNFETRPFGEQGKPRDIFQTARDLTSSLEHGKQGSVRFRDQFRSDAKFFGALAGEIK